MDLLKEEAPCVTRAVRYMRGHFKIITFMGEAASVSQTAQLMREIFSRESARETEGMSLPAEPLMMESFRMTSSMGEAVSVIPTDLFMRGLSETVCSRGEEDIPMPTEPFMRGSFGMESPAAVESICFPMGTVMKEKYKTGSFTVGDV